MTTHFITAEIAPQESALKTCQTIEAELRKQGEPLRWAITRADAEKLYVEAVVMPVAEPIPTP